MRNNKGITMISLVITIIVLLIVTSITVHNGLVQMKIKRVNNLYADIDSLSTKVAEYYLKNKTIPIYNEPYVDDKNELQVLFNNNGATETEKLINVNDEGAYYVLDLSKLDNLTLNYGDDYKTWNSSEPKSQNVYIINTVTHQIYYPHGIKMDNDYYFTKFPDKNIISPIELSESTDSLSITITNISGEKYLDNKIYITADVELNGDLSSLDENTLEYAWSETNYEGEEENLSYTKFTLNENSTNAILSSKGLSSTAEYYYLNIKVMDKNGEYKYYTIQNLALNLIKTPEQIKQEEVKIATNIGKKINFVSQYSDNLIWRLFYADDDYVYLISSKLSSDGTKEINSQKTAAIASGYLGAMDQHTGNYSGSAAITDQFLRSLNSTWYLTLGSNEATNENAKAVAWLMDQNVWSGWKDENGLAKYVIGGPTLELFAKSYNSTASSNNTNEIKYTANTEFGYSVTNRSNVSNEILTFNYNNNHGIYTSKIEEVYTDTGYESYWIASPREATQDGSWIYTIKQDKGFYIGKSFYALGVRPVAIIRTEDYVNSNLRIIEE